MREEIAQTCGSVDAAAFDAYVDWLRRLYLVEMPNFIDRNYDSPLELLSSPGALAKLIRLGAFARLGAVVRRRFKDDRLHRLFSFQAMYAGLAPESALALYSVITYMDTIEGSGFPRAASMPFRRSWRTSRRRLVQFSATAIRWKRSCAHRRDR
jgi:phytoene desaturase